MVLFVETPAKDTLGRRIVEGEPLVEILGRHYFVRAKFHTIAALSGHADTRTLRDFIEKLGGGIQTAFCVHGEPRHCKANAWMLKGLGIPNVHAPISGQRFEDV